MTIDYKREDITIDSISIKSLKQATKFYFYEFYNIYIEDLPSFSPIIVLCCQTGEKIKIHYGKIETPEEINKFQKELNYILYRILED